MAATKQEPAAPLTAEPEQQPVAQPQTAQEIAATEQELGLGAPGPAPGKAIAQRTPFQLGISPTTPEEGWRLSIMLSKSDLVPVQFRGRPADILVAIQSGIELGFPPMQSLQSIAVINGRTTVWGDGFLALLMSSPLYEDHEEYFEVDGERRDTLTPQDLNNTTAAAVCTFYRRGKKTPVTRRFSIAQASKAGLLGKKGPWTQYPDRMMTMRARGFAGRDAFPDLLRGIRTAEEAMTEPPENVLPEPEVPVIEGKSPTIAPAAVEFENAKKRVQSLKDVGLRDHGPLDAVAQPPQAEEKVLEPGIVVAVDQFMGGFTITLSNGAKADTTDVAEAIELEKFKSTKKPVRFTVAKAADGEPLQLKSFEIAD